MLITLVRPSIYALMLVIGWDAQIQARERFNGATACTGTEYNWEHRVAISDYMSFGFTRRLESMISLGNEWGLKSGFTLDIIVSDLADGKPWD